MPSRPRRTPAPAPASASDPEGPASPRTRPAASRRPVPSPSRSLVPVSAAKPVEDKPGKHKPVRDSFTMPPDDYALIAQIKQRALNLAHPAKKSELLRAGLRVLAGLGDTALLAALTAVPPLKTGRPKKHGAAPLQNDKKADKKVDKKASAKTHKKASKKPKPPKVAETA